MLTKADLKQLLKDDNAELAIEALCDIARTLNNTNLLNDVTHHSARFRRATEEKMLGVTSREDLNRDFNQINQALLVIIDGLTELVEPKELLLTVPPSTPAVLDVTNLKRLLREMKSASSALLRWKNELSIIDEHIPRHETEKVLEWIFKPIEENPKSKEKAKPIAVIHGGPGVGKSVIMRELCENLNSKKVPTLGIRSELYRAENIDSLQKSLDFSNAIVETVQMVAGKFPLVVVLIDQIDALSQSFSANRLYLDTYNRLIWELVDLENVRVIISSRTFDLNNDPALKEYAKSSSFEIHPLEPAQVEAILNKLKVKPSALHPDVLTILRIPNNLDVFCRIFQKTTKLNQLQNLQNLYNELWEQAIERLEQSGILYHDSVTELVEEIAKVMNRDQRLSLSSSSLMLERKVKAKKWLVSEGILLERNKEVQFFHQTFYEYLFAKQFVRHGGDLLNYISEHHQGLACRSSVKLILQFYRDNDHQAYLNWIQKFVFGDEVRFHFKHLALSILANQASPSKLEKQLVMQKILPNKRFGFLFLQLVTNHDWILFFLENGVVFQLAFPETKRPDELVVHIPDEFGRGSIGNARRRLQFLLRDFAKVYPETVLSFYNSLPEFEEKPEIVADMLYMLEDWSNPVATAFFEQYDKAVRRDVFLFFTILEHAVEQQFDWVLEQFRPFLLNKEEAKAKLVNDGSYGHHEKQLTDLIFKFNRYRAFDFYLEIFLEILEKESTILSEVRKHFRSSLWFDANPDDEFFGESGSGLIFIKLVEEIRHYATHEPVRFMRFFEKYRTSKWADILSLLLHGIVTNPENYVYETLTLTTSICKRGGLKAYQLSKVRYLIRSVLSKNAHLLSPAQWSSLKKILLSLLEKNDAWIDERSTIGKKKFRGYYGHELLLYLQCLPNDFLKKDAGVWKQYLELNRKYGTIEDLAPGGGGVYSVPPPLLQSAYEKMNAKQWERSFRKYNKDYRPNLWSRRGDSFQHRSEFQKCVKENPGKFIGLIEKLIEDETIDFMYVSAGLDGLREVKIDASTFTLLLKKATKRKLEDSYDVNSIIRQMRFFTGEDSCDPELMSWLEGLILLENIPEIVNKTQTESESEKNSPFKVLGSIVSEAVYEWMLLFRCKQHEDRIFSVLNKAVIYPWHEVRLSMVRAIPYLMNLSKLKSLDLFLSVVARKEEDVIKECYHALQYLVWVGFEALLPFLKSISDIEEKQPDIAFALAVQWIEGKVPAWDILKPILDANPKAVAKMPEVALRKLKEKRNEILPRCQELFEMFLEHPADEVMKAYDHSLHLLKQEHFEIAIPILKAYKTTKAAKKIPAAFFNYLRMCASRYPEEVVELMDFWDHYDNPDIFHEHYYRDEPMHILIALERLFSKNIEKHGIKLGKVLDMVDKMLENPQLKGISNEKLEKAEIG